MRMGDVFHFVKIIRAISICEYPLTRPSILCIMYCTTLLSM